VLAIVDGTGGMCGDAHCNVLSAAWCECRHGQRPGYLRNLRRPTTVPCLRPVLW
jgi:hypothetical protein